MDQDSMNKEEINALVERILKIFTEGSVTEIIFKNDENIHEYYTPEELQDIDKRYHFIISGILRSILSVSPTMLRHDEQSSAFNAYDAADDILVQAVNLHIFDDPTYKLITNDDIKDGFALIDDRKQVLYGTRVRTI